MANTPRIKELPDEVVRMGFKYRKLASTQHHCIWEQSKGGRVVAYEIGMRKHRVPNSFLGDDISYDLIEGFWSNEDIGNIAHSYRANLEEATERYEALTQVEAALAKGMGQYANTLKRMGDL